MWDSKLTRLLQDSLGGNRSGPHGDLHGDQFYICIYIFFFGGGEMGGSLVSYTLLKSNVTGRPLSWIPGMRFTLCKFRSSISYGMA